MNASVLEYSIFGAIALSFMGAIGNSIAYNPALALFGLYVYNSNSARITAWYMGIVVLTVIFDITWCGIWGPGINDGGEHELASTEKFGLAMTILYMFLKLPQLLLFYAHLNSLGGIDAAKDSSSGGPASGGHYTDFDEGAPSSYQDSSYDNKPYTAPSDDV